MTVLHSGERARLKAPIAASEAEDQVTKSMLIAIAKTYDELAIRVEAANPDK